MHPVECSGMRLLGQHDLGGHGNCGEGDGLVYAVDRGGGGLYILQFDGC